MRIKRIANINRNNVQNMYKMFKTGLVGTHLVKVGGVSGMLDLNHVGTPREHRECVRDASCAVNPKTSLCWCLLVL